MEFFRFRRDIPFMRHALVFNLISFLTFAAAVFFLITRGLHLSIEFTGGTVIETEYAQSADIAKVRATVEAMNLGEVQVQKFGTSRDVLIRLPLREGVQALGLLSPRLFEPPFGSDPNGANRRPSFLDTFPRPLLRLAHLPPGRRAPGRAVC